MQWLFILFRIRKYYEGQEELSQGEIFQSFQIYFKRRIKNFDYICSVSQISAATKPNPTLGIATAQTESAAAAVVRGQAGLLYWAMDMAVPLIYLAQS